MKKVTIVIRIFIILIMSQNSFGQEDEVILKNKRLASPSHKALMKIHAKYKSSNNGCECLKLITDSYTEEKWVSLGVDRNNYEYVTHTTKKMKNICARNYILLGIGADEDKKNGEIIYSDKSEIIPPGGSFDLQFVRWEIDDQDPYYVNFYPTTTLLFDIGDYNDYVNGVTNKYTAPITNTSTVEITNLANNSPRQILATVLGENKLEINSYTNTTNINIKKGNKINISASGSIKFGVMAGSGDPNGINGYTNYSIVEGFRHGSLLVRIGDSGEWEPVGTSKSIIAKNNGILQFMVNDADPSNNSGEFWVNIKIIRSQ